MPRHAFAVVLYFFSYAAFTSAIAAELTPAQKQLNIESFEKVWTTVRDNHWDPKLGGVDWQAAHEDFRPKVDRAATMAEARDAMRGMLGRLHQTHFGIIPGDLYEEVDGKTPVGLGDPGIDLRVIGGQALVTEVEANSAAAKAGVRPGWRIVRIEGADVASTIEGIDSAYRDSTLREMTLARAIRSRLQGGSNGRVKVRFLDEDNKRADLTLVEGPPRGVESRFGLLPPQFVWFESRTIENKAGYIAFNMFLDPARLMPAFEEALKSFQKTRGVIVDLRGNPGGIGIMAMGIAGWFVDKPGLQLGTMYTRQTPLNFVVNPRVPSYHGKLAILVDGLSASTSEIFAGGLQDLKRARIFGTRTAGAALPSFIQRLPNGDGFQCATANYISQGGKVLEGNGVIPDVEAGPTRDLLLKGHDAALESAIHWVETP